MYDIQTGVISSYIIKAKSIFEKIEKSCRVTDIKCHPDKMHRLLISYESTGVAVFSLNKNRPLFTI